MRILAVSLTFLDARRGGLGLSSSLVENNTSVEGDRAQVPMPGTQKWIASLGLPEVDAWHPWTAPGTMAVSGYASTFAPNFTFATVRDAGHMSPRYKPSEVLFLVDQWLQQHTI